MNRDRIFLPIGAACLAFGSYYVLMRLLSGDAVRDASIPLIEPSVLREGMKEIGGLDKGISDDLKLLTADDCDLIELQSLAMAKLANDLRSPVPGEVAKASDADRLKLMDATIEAARNLAKVAGEGENAEGPKVSKAYRNLTESCVICHKSFGVR